MSHAVSSNEPGLPSSRSSMLWAVLGAVAAGQLFAFWLVCSQQVRKAEARRDEAAVQQMALADCLQYIPGSTIASCNARNDPQPAVADTGATAMTATVPVSFTFR